MPTPTQDEAICEALMNCIQTSAQMLKALIDHFPGYEDDFWKKVDQVMRDVRREAPR